MKQFEFVPVLDGTRNGKLIQPAVPISGDWTSVPVFIRQNRRENAAVGAMVPAILHLTSMR